MWIHMCGSQQSRGGPVTANAKSTELYAMKAGPPIVKLFNIWHFMNKVALFFTHSCVLDLMCGIKGFM